MDAQTIALVMVGTSALGIVVWVLANLGKTLIQIAETPAAAAVTIFVRLLMIKAVL